MAVGEKQKNQELNWEYYVFAVSTGRKNIIKCWNSKMSFDGNS